MGTFPNMLYFSYFLQTSHLWLWMDLLIIFTLNLIVYRIVYFSIHFFDFVWTVLMVSPKPRPSQCTMYVFIYGQYWTINFFNHTVQFQEKKRRSSIKLWHCLLSIGFYLYLDTQKVIKIMLKLLTNHMYVKLVGTGLTVPVRHS